MSNVDYRLLNRQWARPNSGGAAIAVRGVSNVTIRNSTISDSDVGIDVSGSTDVTLSNNKVNDCKVAVIGHGTKNLAILDMKINGFRLKDFTGDFDFLSVMSADEILYLGEMLSSVDLSDRPNVLEASKLWEYWDSRPTRRGLEAMALIGFLISLSQCVKG